MDIHRKGKFTVPGNEPPRQRRCAMLTSTEKGNIRYLEMNHPVNDAGYVELRGICKGNIVKQIESQKQ